MGLEPMWTDLSDMLATCTDDQLLKWKEVAENPRGDNFKFITTLRQVVVHMYNKSAKDIVNELSAAVDNELKLRWSNNMDKKLEQRIARLEKLVNERLLERRLAKLESALNESKQDLSRVCKLIEKQVAEELEFTGWLTGSRVWDEDNNIINVSIQGDDYDISDEYDADFWIEVLDDGGFEVEWWRHEPVHADSVSDVVDIIVEYANNF